MRNNKFLIRTGIRIIIAMCFSFTSLAGHASDDKANDPSTPAGRNSAMSRESNQRITTMDELIGMQPSPDVNVHGIGIYVYDGIESLDAIGPFQVFKSAGLNTFLIAKNKGSITMSNGLIINVDKSIDDVEQLDVLVVAGGAHASAQQTLDTEVLGWIQKIDQTTVYTASVCTGAWILGAAGLLQDKDATTHWYRAEEMLTKYGADFKQKRWVRDGKYWTSAGVTAGMDMALALVNHLFGKDYTQAIMLDLEYDPQPPIRGGTPKKSLPVIAQLMKEMFDYYLLNFVNCPLGSSDACLSNP
jgi:transcriptional regulator GlxA family with amidase domain